MKVNAPEIVVTQIIFRLKCRKCQKENLYGIFQNFPLYASLFQIQLTYRQIQLRYHQVNNLWIVDDELKGTA